MVISWWFGICPCRALGILPPAFDRVIEWRNSQAAKKSLLAQPLELGVATDGRPSHDDLIRHHGVQSWRGTFARGSDVMRQIVTEARLWPSHDGNDSSPVVCSLLVPAGVSSHKYR